MLHEITQDDAERLDHAFHALCQLARESTQQSAEGAGVLAAALCFTAVENDYSLDDVLEVVRVMYELERGHAAQSVTVATSPLAVVRT